MKNIGTLSAKIRQQLLARRIHREIEQRIFPQLAGDMDCGYPFKNSDKKLECMALHGELDLKLQLDMIEHRAKQLPETYGKAFRYLMYRDLNERMGMYLEFVRERTPRKAALVASQPLPAT
jgi:hypothetical protein